MAITKVTGALVDIGDLDLTNVGTLHLDSIVSDASPAAITIGYGINDTLTINGSTILEGAVTINESSADVDFRVESTGDANMLVVDGGNDRVGIGTSPDYRMHIFTSDSSAGAHGNADDLFIENAGNAGMTIGSGTTSNGSIFFSDSGSTLSGQIEYRHSDDSLMLITGATNRLHIKGDGDIDITNGNLIVADGHGIDFSATGNGSGSMASELLDDYEEGTWTPVLSGASTAGTFSAGSGTAGRYIKIGKLCYVAVSIRNSTLSSAAGALKISGLPYATYDNQLFSISSALMMHNFNFDTNDVQAFYAANDVLNGIESVNGAAWTDWNVTNTSALYLQFTCVYEVDE